MERRDVGSGEEMKFCARRHTPVQSTGLTRQTRAHKQRLETKAQQDKSVKRSNLFKMLGKEEADPT